MAFSLTFFDIAVFFKIYNLFPGNKSRIWHIQGTDTCECVVFGAAWLYLRGQLGLGGGMPLPFVSAWEGGGVLPF